MTTTEQIREQERLKSNAEIDRAINAFNQKQGSEAEIVDTVFHAFYLAREDEPKYYNSIIRHLTAVMDKNRILHTNGQKLGEAIGWYSTRRPEKKNPSQPNPTQMSESMNLHKKFIYCITESNYAEANKVLEQLAEGKLRDRITGSLSRVDEGLFDRLGARASGMGAGLKAKAQNAATRVGSTVKAVGQNIAGAATGKGFGAGQATVDAANKQIADNNPAKKAKAGKADNLIASFAKDLSILYPGLNTNKILTNLRTQINLARPQAKATAKKASPVSAAISAPATAHTATP